MLGSPNFPWISLGMSPIPLQRLNDDFPHVRTSTWGALGASHKRYHSFQRLDISIYISIYVSPLLKNTTNKPSAASLSPEDFLTAPAKSWPTAQWPAPALAALIQRWFWQRTNFHPSLKNVRFLKTPNTREKKKHVVLTATFNFQPWIDKLWLGTYSAVFPLTAAHGLRTFPISNAWRNSWA